MKTVFLIQLLVLGEWMKVACDRSGLLCERSLSSIRGFSECAMCTWNSKEWCMCL